MRGAAVVAYGAVSALGEGPSALGVAPLGARAPLAIAKDDELLAAGLARPFAARALALGQEDRAAALLKRALAVCVGRLERVVPAWRSGRTGLVLGTSSGGMRAAERAFAAIARGDRAVDPEGSTYFGPMAAAARWLDVVLDPAMLVLGACASGALAVGLASRWLARGTCDLVLAGGFDEVTVFVAAGFEALRATSSVLPPRPFRLGRDGMALGEGAAVIALAAADRHPAARVFVTGFGASADALHVTAPDRTGAGLARAGRAALDEAGKPRVDLVSPHATATPFNDAAEWRALASILGEERARAVPVHPLKAQIGHTLGAAGALEALACAEAIARGVVPAAAGEGALDPESPACVLDATRATTVDAALKLSAAFGGANAALVLERAPRRTPASLRPAYVGPAVHVPEAPHLERLARVLGLTTERLARVDGLVLLALAAVSQLEGAAGSRLAGAGVIVGSALSTLETNSLFAARIRDRGAAAAEPRRFPYTSPNVVAGECAIAFGLTGPNFSVGGGMHAALEALAAGALLVEGGDAERMIVVAADDAGPATRALFGGAVTTGAVAVLLSASPLGAHARVAALEVSRGHAPETVDETSPRGHRVLLPLVHDSRARELRSASPPDARARVRLEPI